MQRYDAVMKRVGKEVNLQNKIEDDRIKLDIKLEDYRRQLRESRYVEQLEAAYRSQELSKMFLRERESFANIDGTYYVRSESYGVVEYTVAASYPPFSIMNSML